MLGIEIARVDGVPLVVKDREFRHQARTSVEEERPAALMLGDNPCPEPLEPALEPYQYRIQQRVR